MATPLNFFQEAGYFITATDTNVGKTYVAAGLAAAMQQHFKAMQIQRTVRLWKPVQSGATIGDAAADSYRLVQGSGLPQTEAETVSYCFSHPLAPSMAARREGQAIDFSKLLDTHEQLRAGKQLVIVEGAGGLLVPLTEHQLIADLALALKYPLLIVARAGLGTVNHTLLTIKQAQAYGLSVRGVILNGYRQEEEQMIEENIEMIESFSQVPVLATLPWALSEPFSSQLTSSHPNLSVKDNRAVQDVQQIQAQWQAWRETWTTIIQDNLKWSLL